MICDKAMYHPTTPPDRHPLEIWSLASRPPPRPFYRSTRTVKVVPRSDKSDSSRASQELTHPLLYLPGGTVPSVQFRSGRVQAYLRWLNGQPQTRQEELLARFAGERPYRPKSSYQKLP